MCLFVPKALPKGVTMVMQKHEDQYVIFYDPNETEEPDTLEMYDEAINKISNTAARI